MLRPSATFCPLRAISATAKPSRAKRGATEAENRRDLTVQGIVLSAAAQALPVGNSNTSSDSGYISIE
jgi:hypothetical protein